MEIKLNSNFVYIFSKLISKLSLSFYDLGSASMIQFTCMCVCIVINICSQVKYTYWEKAQLQTFRLQF